MTQKEAELILLEVLLHTQNSRADYFRIKAAEGNHDPVTFLRDLMDAYKRIEEYVNSFNYDEWSLDEKGEKIFFKKTLNLFNATSGKVIGYLDHENIYWLLKPLHEFGQKVINERQREIDNSKEKIIDLVLQNIKQTILESKEKKQEIKSLIDNEKPMKNAIPKIEIDFASKLPRVIADFLYRGISGKPLFIHVNFNENIDFYSFSANWELLKLKMEDGMIKDEAGNQLTFATILPYLEAYSLGFLEGFNELEQQINSGLFASDEIKARKVIEFSDTWRSGWFPEQAGDGKPGLYITKELWHNAGIEAGHFYKAWYIITDNHEPFLKYFEKEKLTGVKSFTWTGSPAQKEALWQALKDAGYIAGTTKEAFTAIFSDELIGCRAIKWRASNRLLSYLFNQMYASNLIAKEWQSIIEKYKLFLNKSGKYLTAQDLASALSETNAKDLQPKGYEKIDKILENIKTV
jgi:hypothetical protein